MSRYLILLFLLFMSTLLIGQNLYYVNASGNVIVLDTEEKKLRYVLNKEFSRLITGNTFSGLGNYATISTEDKTLEASINILRDKNVWDFNISGGSMDGITSLFTDDEFNEGISIGFAYHRIIGKPTISFNAAETQNIERKIVEIRAKKLVDIAKANAFEYRIGKEITKKNNEIARINAQITANPVPIPAILQNLNAQKAFLHAELLKLQNELQDYRANLSSIKGQIKHESIKAEKEAISKLEKVVAKDFSVTWFTVGAEMSYQSFDLFDQTRPLDERIFSEEDLVPSFQASISHYTNKDLLNPGRVGAKHVKFYSLGVMLKADNNGSRLESKDIVTEENIDTGETLTSTETVLTGIFENDIFSAEVFGDFYQFIGAGNDLGIHLRGILTLGEFKPISSIRFGALFPFKNTKDQSSFLNLELFFEINDFFNNTPENSMLNKNIIGVQATVPFNFKIF